MPFNNNINDFIVPAQDAYLYQLVYNQVYGGLTGCTVNINGTTVEMGPNSTIDIIVKSISGGTGCSVSGDRPYVFGDSLQYKYVPQTFVSVWDTSRTSSGSSTGTQVKLPLVSTGTYNFIVDWGDGSSNKITTWNQAETTHTYASAGVYQLIITGTLYGFTFYNGSTGVGDRLKLLTIFKWGTGFRLGNNAGYFWGCQNLQLNQVEDVLDLTNTTHFGSIFRECANLTTINGINEWDTSKVTLMGGVFLNCIRFNDNISNWNTSNVTDMTLMFYCDTGYGVFNQYIGNWNTSKVTNMTSMFYNQTKFNQDINTKVVTVNGLTYTAWDTSKVTTIQSMFSIVGNTGVFNQDIGNWDTSKVTTMSSAFQRQIYFNQNINTKQVTVNNLTYNAWDTTNVTTMQNMLNCTLMDGSFNQDIGNWNTSKVTNMGALFSRQPNFNQNISTKVVTVGGSTYVAWDTTNVTSMSFMFNNTNVDGSFNQNIGNWNTNKVTTMSQMFTGQPYFNQDVSTKSVTVSATTYSAWTVSAVTNMNYMFYSYDPTTTGRLAGNFNNNGSSSINNWDVRKVTTMLDIFNYQTGFNQPIGNWVISGVTSFSFTGLTSGFMYGKTSDDYSSANYDALLIGWASRSVKTNQLLNMGTIKYTSAAVSARNTLTSAPNNWTIIDGGLE